MLQHLELYRDHQCSNIKLELYPSLKNLELEFQHFNKLSLPSTSVLFNQLDALRLDAENCNNEILQKFVKQNHLNLSNVTKLTLCAFEQHFDRNLITKLLSKLPRLKELKLLDFACDIDVNAIRKALLHLNALKIGTEYNLAELNGGVRNKDLVHAFGDKLEFLAFNEKGDMDYKLDSVNFENLQYFDGRHMSSKSINDILKTAVNLKKFEMHVSHSMKLSKLKEIIIKVINDCKSLDYLRFDCDKGSHRGIVSVLNGIEKGLFQTKQREREQIKVYISAAFSATEEAQSLILNIERIINWLQNPQIKDFMFIWDIGDSKNIDKELLLKDLKCVGYKTKSTLNDTKLIITNNNCKINGYYEMYPIDFDISSY